MSNASIKQNSGAASSEIPDWLPNWREPSEYPDAKKTTARQWAWEFLRRNPEYQRLWEQVAAPYYSKERGLSDALALDTENEKIRSDSVYAEKYKTEDGYKILSPSAIIFERFRVRGALPPSERKHNLIFSYENPHSPPIQYLTHPADRYNSAFDPGPWKAAPITLEKGQVLVWMNTDKPIQPQLNMLKKVLKGFSEAREGTTTGQRPSRRFRPYQDYLRILDARQAGIPQSEIAKVIYISSKKRTNDVREATKAIYEDIKIAERLRDKDYLYI
jgi:hypothetical protein